MEVSADAVSVTVDGVTILHPTSLRADAGRVVGVVGPNGSGKSTLLKVIYRAWKPGTGTVLVGDDSVWSLRPREAARRIGVLHQADDVGFDFTVEEIVGLGRLPHQRLPGQAGDHDRAIVAEALERCSVGHLRHRLVDSLSGGERQRALIARALAQQPRVLVLDEPSNHLDIGSQLDLLTLVRDLGVTVVTALHDLNLALAYCDDVVVLHRGRVLDAGPVEDVLTEDLVGDVYGVRCHRGVHPLTGRLTLSFAPPPPVPPSSTANNQGDTTCPPEPPAPAPGRPASRSS
jgi:iron complex transport system ATP-binding protein